ncbi:MAG: hypothetical protein AAGA76_15595, partial [Pseudomonadota bacterium]
MITEATTRAYVLPPHLEQLEENLKSMAKQRMWYTLLGIGVIVFILVSGISMANADNASSFWDGLPRIFKFPYDMSVEAWEKGFAWFGLLLEYFPQLINTINVALFSTLLGFCFAVVLSCFASKNLV